jgi:succinoglycan biosynthesis transport protein ExoP
MSKIERALRKAEEERRLKERARPPVDKRGEEAAAVFEGVKVPEKAGYHLEHASEHFRKITAKLKSFYDSVGPTDIVFTSGVSGEGKTTCAVNCAVSLCRDFNLAVCLVDCDLRNPTISDYFDPNGSPGVIEFLKGEFTLDSVIQGTDLKGLSVIQTLKPETITLPLLNTERFRRFVEELRKRFDIVIFDSSPVLPVTDTVVISKSVSAVVLIIEAGKTRRKHIEQVLEQMGDEKIIGFIMNYKEQRVPQAYGYGKYYSQKYGSMK